MDVTRATRSRIYADTQNTTIPLFNYTCQVVFHCDWKIEQQKEPL